MWTFKKKPVGVPCPAGTYTAGDLSVDEHTAWGVGGPGTLPSGLFADTVDTITAVQDIPVAVAPTA